MSLLSYGFIGNNELLSNKPEINDDNSIYVYINHLY